MSMSTEATIRAESDVPLRCIYQRFSSLPISNVDPYYTDTGIQFWDKSLELRDFIS